jgi:hypothetical protein
MTESEMQALRAEWGVREPGKDYNLLVDGHGTGLAPPTEEEWASMVGRTKVVEGADPATSNLPTSYDLSSQPFFPKVGNQGSQGSCSAWAATYYAYGYLEAMDNNWSDAQLGSNPAHLMSPAWTYNRVNGGVDNGSWMAENLQVIVDWGVASLATMPYSQTDLVSWGGQEAFREAPLHRAAGYTEEYWLKGEEAVALVKNRVASNMPVTFALDAYQYGPSFRDNLIMSAAEYNGHNQNHANTIVGYDDSITDDGEQGAFRVVNSWGSGWGDHGYYWLTYDALKKMSNGPGLFLTEVADLTDYVPQMLAVWHFDNAPVRSDAIEVSQGKYPTVVRTLTPSFAGDGGHTMPSFMCLDITELSAAYEAGNTSFWIRLSGAGGGVLSSFRIERYENGYVPGVATQASSQSLEAPRNLPGRALVEFPEYAPIDPTEALDSPSLVARNGGQASWVGVPLQSAFNGSCLQSGDVGDGGTSSFQVTVTGWAGVEFQWKVGSETGKDVFSFMVDGARVLNYSGNSDWQQSNRPLTSAQHVLRWEYVKDLSNSDNQDIAWIDHLRLIPPDDRFENNDISSQAAALSSSGYYPGLVWLDADWYKVWVNSSDSLSIQVDHRPADGSLAASLFESDASTLISSSQSASGTDSLTTGRVPLSGYYFLRVLSPAGDYLPYSITCARTSGWFDQGSTSRLTIISGTGDFGSITNTQREMTGFVDGSLAGSISIYGSMAWNSSALVPLVATPSWGDRASAWWTVSANMSRVNATYTTFIDHLLLPTDPGTYYLIFAARNESSGAYLSSSTSSMRPSPIWNDGNDLAALPSEGIEQAMQTGRTVVRWLMVSGPELVWLPADAIRVKVVVPDLAPPVTTARVAGTLGQQHWYRSSVSVSLTATDGDGSGVGSTAYRLDGGQWRSYGIPLILGQDGSHVLEYRSQDLAGNVEITKLALVKIDKAPPAVGLNLTGSMGQMGWYVSPVTIGIEVSDMGSGPGSIYVRLDSGGWAICNGTEVRINDGGEHLFEVYALDEAGNPSGVQVRSVLIDLDVPVTTMQVSGSHYSGPWYSGTVSVNLTSLDADSGVGSTYFSLDGGPFQMYPGSIALTATGQHDLSFYSVDRAGNIEGIKNGTVLVDDTPPLCHSALFGVERGGWYNSTAILNLSASDEQSGIGAIWYRIGSGDWLIYRGNLSFEDGAHAVEFFALDCAGLESGHQTVLLQVDSSGPNCTADIGGALGKNSWYLSNAILNLSAMDSLSGVQAVYYRWDGGAWTLSVENVTFDEEGAHLVEFYALDLAGNQGATSTLRFGIDKTAPTCHLTIDGDIGENDWFVSSARISASCEDAISGPGEILMSIDGGPWSNSTAEVQIHEDGVHQLRYYSVDQAGNQEVIKEAWVKIDLTGPSCWLNVSGPSPKDGWFGAEVELSLVSIDPISGTNQSYYRLDEGNWALFEAPFTVGEGRHVIGWYATDRAGNHGNYSSQAIDVDLSSPRTDPHLNGTGGNGGWFLSNIGLTFDGEDQLSGLNRTMFKMDGAPWSEFTGPISVEGEGRHIILYYSIDRVGNVEGQRNLTIRLDLNAPSTAYLIIGNLGAGDWFVSPVNLSLSASDSVSGLSSTAYRLDRGLWQIYLAPIQVDVSGMHEVEFRSIDGAGNMETLRALHLDIDLSPPSAICNDSGRVFVTHDPSISLWIDEEGSGMGWVEASLDGGAAHQVNWSEGKVVLRSVSDGPHQLRLTFTDLAGNSVAKVVDFRVDTNPLSTQGPIGPWLLVLMIVVVLALVAFFVWTRRSKSG